MSHMSFGGNPAAPNGNDAARPSTAQRMANRWFKPPVYPNLKLEYSDVRGEPLPQHRRLPVITDSYQEESEQYGEMADEEEKLQEALKMIPEPDCDNDNDVAIAFFSMNRALARSSPVAHSTNGLQRYVDTRKNTIRTVMEDECVEIPAPQHKDNTSTKNKGKRSKKATTKNARQPESAAPAAPAAPPIYRMRTRAQKQRQAESENSQSPSEVQQVASTSTTSSAALLSVNTLAADSGPSSQQLSNLTPADFDAAATLLSMSKSGEIVQENQAQPVSQHAEAVAEVQQPVIAPTVTSALSTNTTPATATQQDVAPIMTDKEAAAILLSISRPGATLATGNGATSSEHQREEPMTREEVATSIASSSKSDDAISGSSSTVAGSSNIGVAAEQGASARPPKPTRTLTLTMPRPGGLPFASTKRKATANAEAGEKPTKKKKKKTDDIPKASVELQGKRRRLAPKSLQQTAATPQHAVFQPDNTRFNDFSTHREASSASVQRSRSTLVLKRKSDYDAEVLRLAWEGLKSIKPTKSSKVDTKSRLPPLRIPGDRRKVAAPEEITAEESAAVQEDVDMSPPDVTPPLAAAATESTAATTSDGQAHLQAQQPIGAVVATGIKRKAHDDGAFPVPEGNKRVCLPEPEAPKPKKAPKTASKKRLPPLLIPGGRKNVTVEKVIKEKAAEEKLTKEKVTKEKVTKEKADQEKAPKEKASKEEVAEEKATKKKAFKEGTAAQSSEDALPELPLPRSIKKSARQKRIEEQDAEMLEEMHSPRRRRGNSIMEAANADHAVRSIESPQRESSVTVRESSVTVRESSATVRESSATVRESSATVRESSVTMRGSSFTIQGTDTESGDEGSDESEPTSKKSAIKKRGTKTSASAMKKSDTTPALRPRRTHSTKTLGTYASTQQPFTDDDDYDSQPAATAAASSSKKIDKRRRRPKPTTVPVPAAIQSAHDDLMALRKAGCYPPVPAPDALRSRTDTGWVVGAQNHTVLLQPVPHFTLEASAESDDENKGDGEGEGGSKKRKPSSQQPLEIWFVDDTTTPPGGVIQRETYARRGAGRRGRPVDLTQGADVRDANKWVAQKLVRWGCARAREDMRARKYADEEVAFLREHARRWKAEWLGEMGAAAALSRKVLADDVTKKLNARFEGRRMRVTYRGRREEGKAVRPGREPAGVDSIMERRGILKELGFPPSTRVRAVRDDDEEAEDADTEEDEEEL